MWTSHSIPKSNTTDLGRASLPNLQSENILFWVKCLYLAVCSNLTSSVCFPLKDAHLSFPIPGDRKGQIVIAPAVFRDQLVRLVVTESMRHCILDQCRLLTVLCFYSYRLRMSLLEPDLDLWWKGLKLVESRACTIISSLPCAPSQINRLVIFSFHCRERAWNTPLFIPCNGSLDVKWGSLCFNRLLLWESILLT